ncbi:unnamed protein product [Dicrocoelium dendriticum]|nr:unnamed protein product [Dicrocoelium dendriticum]
MRFQLRDTISSNIDKPYEAVGCSVSSLTGYPEINHVIVKLETTGSIESQKFASELFGECENRMTNLNVMDLNLQQPFSAVNNQRQTTIRIAVRFVGDDSKGEWHSAYGSATEVIHIAEAACSKFTKRANTKKISDNNNSTCTVTGPQRKHVKGEFLLYFELDDTDAIKVTEEAIEKRNITKIGYDIRDLQIEFPSPTR